MYVDPWNSCVFQIVYVVLSIELLLVTTLAWFLWVWMLIQILVAAICLRYCQQELVTKTWWTAQTLYTSIIDCRSLCWSQLHFSNISIRATQDSINYTGNNTHIQTRSLLVLFSVCVRESANISWWDYFG